MSFVVNDEVLDDEEKFRKVMQNRVMELRGVDLKVASDFEELISQIQVTNQPMFDLDNRDDTLSQVKIKNIPMVNTHIGSFVYIASLITAIGRSQVTSIINRMSGQSRVFYADTDSIILNRKGAE